MITRNDIELIGKYLDGELREPHLSQFRKKLQFDESMKKKVEFMRMVRKLAIHDGAQRLRDQLKQIDLQTDDEFGKTANLQFAIEEDPSDLTYHVASRKIFSEENIVFEPSPFDSKPTDSKPKFRISKWLLLLIILVGIGIILWIVFLVLQLI